MKVLELWSGMGGMHWALKMSKISYEVVAAMEINPVVLEIYRHNFPETNASPRNIESLTVDELNSMEIDMILMSPPCQPFCRTGLQLDTKDSRTSSLVQLCTILPDVKFKYILVENVQGFEKSDTRNELLFALSKCGFRWQEFLLTPKTFRIPNSRLRYYLIGKKADLQWSFDLDPGILHHLPNSDVTQRQELEDTSQNNSILANVIQSQNSIWNVRQAKSCKTPIENDLEEYDRNNLAWNVSCILEDDTSITEFRVPDKIIQKYGKAMDVVDENSTNTCCFTKGYGHFVKGTGSMLNISDNTTSGENNILRYFTPREIARLMCYPEEFKFPNSLSVQQQYRALGNSLNVYLVSLLIASLSSE